MRRILFVIAVFFVLNANAQNHLISFAATGESSTVSSVEVENMTTGTSLTLDGDDVLRLTIATGIYSPEYNNLPELQIYPNPMMEKSRLLFSPPEAGDAAISVYDIAGRQLAQHKSYLEDYIQEFELSGMDNGMYIVHVKGINFHLSGKLISNGVTKGGASIEKVSGTTGVDKKVFTQDTKGVQAVVDMEYTAGDILKFKAVSGDYCTIVTDIPVTDKTVTFNFIACSDGDGNNYPVVEIGYSKSGTQFWMGANLKTTRYNNGSDIPFITDNTTWTNLVTPGACWYSNNEAMYKDTYGAMYNWYAVNTGNLCPAGWHVPTDEEWTVLTISHGFSSTTGGRLRERGTEHWLNETGATDETCFKALPGGYRNGELGNFNYLGFKGYWWSATEVVGPSESISAWHRELTSGVTYVLRSNYEKDTGFSVRCLKD